MRDFFVKVGHLEDFIIAIRYDCVSKIWMFSLWRCNTSTSLHGWFVSDFSFYLTVFRGTVFQQRLFLLYTRGVAQVVIAISRNFIVWMQTLMCNAYDLTYFLLIWGGVNVPFAILIHCESNSISGSILYGFLFHFLFRPAQLKKISCNKIFWLHTYVQYHWFDIF